MNTDASVKKAKARPVNDDYITTREAADMLGVTVRTIQNWVDSGKLFARLTLGGHRRLLRAEVEKFMGPSNEPKVSARTLDSRLRILVVEDNLKLLDLYKLRFSLFKVPHELMTADDGVQGLIMVGRFSPHLMLMDLKMPNMDGFKMLQTLQGMPESQGMKIIVVTGLPASEILQGGGLPPGVSLLPKPVPFDTLEALCMQRATELGFVSSQNP